MSVKLVAKAPKELARPVALDLLSVPMPDEPFLVCEHCRRRTHGAISLEGRAQLPAHLLAPDDEGEGAFYRWLVGHHVAVCTWRLLADTLDTVRQAPTAITVGLDHAAFLMDAYSALLVYAGSCTPEIYGSVIRTRMVESNPSFSGTWARDFERVRQLLDALAPAATSALGMAQRNNRIVHMMQAKRLVPSGVSLLQASKGRTDGETTAAERDLFDRFFRLERRRVCEWEFRAQLSRRVSLILCDLQLRPMSNTGLAGPVQQSALMCEEILKLLADHSHGETS